MPPRLRERRTVQGMRYRQTPAEALSGCSHLRCKAFLITVLGVIMVASFPATYASALLIVGTFLILLGGSLFFMYCVARDLGKNDATAGQGVNRSWNRLRHQRIERRRRRNSSRQSRRATTNENTESEETGDAPPPAYETTISVEELMRCPEPTDWTFLPTEPPPEYFPPTTALDSNNSSTETADNQPGADQSDTSVYSISRQMSYTLPTYEQALNESNEEDADDGSISQSRRNTFVVEMDNGHSNETFDSHIEFNSTSLREANVSHQVAVPHTPTIPVSIQGIEESSDTIAQVVI